MSEIPPLTLHADRAVGLFIRYAETGVTELSECLTADRFAFSLQPAEAAHLAQTGKAVIVFGQQHPQVVKAWFDEFGEPMVLGPEVALPEDAYRGPAAQLLSLGAPQEAGRRDYPCLGVSAADIPALIRMATDDLLHLGPPESPAVYAPVHAWRTLVQLRATEAIGPLVGLFRRVDEDIDEWIGDELPRELAAFGAAALEPLTTFLSNVTHGDWSRVAAARTLGEIGKSHPELRVDCIARLSAQLDRFTDQSETLNAFLISPLFDLRAVEAMPVIERAFASGRVDEAVLGDVEDVQIEFGLKREHEHPRKPNRLTTLGDQLRAKWRHAGLPLPDADGNFPEPLPDAINAPPAAPRPYIAPTKVGRNDPCPCGSGKKYKKCCGA